MCHADSCPVVPAFQSNFMHFGKVLKKKYPNFTFSYRDLRCCPIRIARRTRYALHWVPCRPTEAIAAIHERHAMGEKEVSSGSTRMPSRRSDSAHLPGYLLDNEQKAGRRMPTIRAGSDVYHHGLSGTFGSSSFQSSSTEPILEAERSRSARSCQPPPRTHLESA